MEKNITYDIFYLTDIQKNILYDTPEQIIYLKELYVLIHQLHNCYEQYKRIYKNSMIQNIKNEEPNISIYEIFKEVDQINKQIYKLFTNYLSWYANHLPNFFSLIITWEKTSKYYTNENDISMEFLHSFLYHYEKIGIPDLIKEKLLILPNSAHNK